MKIFVLSLFSAVLLVACQSAPSVKTDSGIADRSSPVREISPQEAQAAVAKAYSQFVDVRTPEEYAAGRASRAKNIPLDALSANFASLDKNEPVYLICETGNRSKKAAAILKDAGFNNVFSVAGGTQAWRAAGLPIETSTAGGR